MAACWRERKNAPMSLIWSSLSGNAGMPLSGRPFRITGPILSPPSSSKARTDRTKSGPLSPPLAFDPWQNPQRATKVFWPRSTAAGSGRSRLIKKLLPPRPGPAGGWADAAGCPAKGMRPPTRMTASKLNVTWIFMPGPVYSIRDTSLLPPWRRPCPCIRIRSWPGCRTSFASTTEEPA